MQCLLRDRIIVWDKDIIHTDCPFNLVAVNTMTKINNLYLDSDNNWLFHAVNIVEFCKMKLVYTEEGLYLSNRPPSSLLKSELGLKLKDNSSWVKN